MSFLRFVSAWLLAFFTCISLAAQQVSSHPGETKQAQDQTSRLDEVMQLWAKPTSPGASIAVIHDGKIVFAKGYGLANLEYDAPITSDTVFNVASIAKQFTAMSIVLLEQEGRLSLEDDVHKYLPELPHYGSTITIRQLLQHTSGIRDSLDLAFLAGWDGKFSQKEILDLIFRQHGLSFTPGTRGMYSNAGYVLLAEIVSRVSGKSLAQFAAERIFEPLGMSHTHFYDDLSSVVPRRASSYFPTGVGFRALPWDPGTVGPCGLATTASDLIKWLDNFRDPKVGGPRAIARMQESPVTVTLGPGLELPYALGVVIGEYRGLRTISHVGNLGGFIGFVSWYPDQHLGVAVLSNRTDLVNSGVTADSVASLYLESQMKPELKAPERTFITLDPSTTKRFAGVYGEAGRRFEISQKDRDLFIAELGSSPVALKPMTSNRFYAVAIQAEIEFIDQPGNHVGFKITQNGTARFGERIVLLPFDPKDMGDYPSRYWSDELETQYTIALRNGKLFATHARNGEWPLIPIAKDEFVTPNLWVNVKFIRDGAAAVTGLSLRAGRVTEVRFTRR